MSWPSPSPANLSHAERNRLSPIANPFSSSTATMARCDCQAAAPAQQSRAWVGIKGKEERRRRKRTSREERHQEEQKEQQRQSKTNGKSTNVDGGFRSLSFLALLVMVMGCCLLPHHVAAAQAKTAYVPHSQRSLP